MTFATDPIDIEDPKLKMKLEDWKRYELLISKKGNLTAKELEEKIDYQNRISVSKARGYHLSPRFEVLAEKPKDFNFGDGLPSFNFGVDKTNDLIPDLSDSDDAMSDDSHSTIQSQISTASKRRHDSSDEGKTVSKKK